MDPLAVYDLRAFVPAKDYAISTQFYQDLGFELVWSSEEVNQFRLDRFTFLLQNFYVQEWAENCMMQLVVADLDAWWAHLQAQQLPERYPGVRIKEPQVYPWGLREIHLLDPAGVLWHIVQGRRLEDG